MKICVIGHPRTRSSHLMEVLSNFYQIPIIGEDLNEHCNKLRDGSWVRTGSPDDLPDQYIKNYNHILTKNPAIKPKPIRTLSSNKFFATTQSVSALRLNGKIKERK